MVEEENRRWQLNRHTLIWMDKKGRRAAWESIGKTEEKREVLQNLIENPAIPAIIRRQEIRREDSWEVGFSSWEYKNGSRIRIAATIPTETITQIRSPFDLFQKENGTTIIEAFSDIKSIYDLGEDFGIEIGLYGSTALQWVTDYPYRNEDSDYDLYLKLKPEASLAGFYQGLQQLEAETAIKVDAELEVDGYGVKLKEWMSSQKTVLGKGLYGAKLLERKNPLE